jgi:hypothetical protein
MKICLCITLAFVLLVMPRVTEADNPGEPNRFFREIVGLNEDQIHAIGSGKAVAKVVESHSPDEVFVFGAVYVDASPYSYLELASDVARQPEFPAKPEVPVRRLGYRVDVAQREPVPNGPRGVRVLANIQRWI